MSYQVDLYGLINNGINKYNDRNTVQRLINDMVGNTNVPNVVESSNKGAAASKFGKAKPVVVHENNHVNMKLPYTGLKSNNILGAHIVEEKKDGLMSGLTCMMSGRITTINPRKRMNQGAHIRSQVTTTFLNSPKLRTIGDQKQDLLVKYLHL